MAILISQLKDFELAEDALQDALIKAWNNWQTNSVPINPQSWILRTAYNHAIDVIRRQQNFQRKTSQVSHLIQLQQELNDSSNDEIITDDRLKLIFTCCHPALDDNSQVALTLNTICGFSTGQVAAMFLVKVPTMGQRLVRAKRKIKRSGIPYKTPEKDQLNQRLGNVLKVIYLIYNQGYYAADNKTLMADSHTDEAIHLAWLLNQLIPKQAELLGLLSLMYFHRARFEARTSNSDELISLEHQDRTMWNQQHIARAKGCFQQAIQLKKLGPYQIQAAISGVHCEARTFAETDWQQITALYQKLYQYLPTDLVKMNLAVAMDHNQQSQAAHQLLQQIKDTKMTQYLPYYLASAQILKSMGQQELAADQLSSAMALSNNSQQKVFIKKQIDALKHSA